MPAQTTATTMLLNISAEREDDIPSGASLIEHVRAVRRPRLRPVLERSTSDALTAANGCYCRQFCLSMTGHGPEKIARKNKTLIYTV